MTFVNEGHMIAASTVLWHATDCSNHISQHYTFVFSSTWDTNGDVAQVGRELWVISSEVRVGWEHPRAKHDSFHTKADQQDIAKQPHWSSLILLIPNKSNQSSLVDVPILGRKLNVQGNVTNYGIFSHPVRIVACKDTHQEQHLANVEIASIQPIEH